MYNSITKLNNYGWGVGRGVGGWGAGGGGPLGPGIPPPAAPPPYPTLPVIITADLTINNYRRPYQ